MTPTAGGHGGRRQKSNALPVASKPKAHMVAPTHAVRRVCMHACKHALRLGWGHAMGGGARKKAKDGGTVARGARARRTKSNACN